MCLLLVVLAKVVNRYVNRSIRKIRALVGCSSITTNAKVNNVDPSLFFRFVVYLRYAGITCLIRHKTKSLFGCGRCMDVKSIPTSWS